MPKKTGSTKVEHEAGVEDLVENLPSVTDASLEFSVLEQVLIFATTLTELAVSEVNMRETLASGDIVSQLIEISSKKPPQFFSCFARQYIDYPTELGKEKRPVDPSFFETDAAAVASLLQHEEGGEEVTIASKIDVKVNSNGALTLTFRAKTDALAVKMEVDQAVSSLRIQREKIQVALSKALERFSEHWNQDFPDSKIRYDGPRSMPIREQFEYLDIDITRGDNRTINVDQWVDDNDTDSLRQLVGFCRMSHKYTRETFSQKFLRRFLENDISNRENELWIIFRERFIRYYPERYEPEAAHLNNIVPILIEQLLAKKSIYRQQISSLKKMAEELPILTELSDTGNGSDSTTIPLKFRHRLIEESLRLQRIQYPSDLAYYANTEHSYNLIRKLEDTFQIGRLSQALETEQIKLTSTIDAISNNAIHGQNMRLQYRMMWVTILIALLASGLTIFQILTS